jgi:hypothetical protein
LATGKEGLEIIMNILNEIQRLGYDARDSNLTGYVNWPKKQELYKILWATQRQLKMCSTFVGEEEWLAEHNEDVIIKKLQGVA